MDFLPLAARPPRFSEKARRDSRILSLLRYPGGMKVLFASRMPECDPDHSRIVFVRKGPLDEAAWIEFLFNRPDWRGSWSSVDSAAAFSPVPMRGIGSALCTDGRLRRMLTEPLHSPPDAARTETVLCLDQENRGRITQIELEEADVLDHGVSFLPVSVSSDLLCPDGLYRSDVFLNTPQILHPPGRAEDAAHFARKLQLALQKHLVLTASHLISIALFEYRLERRRFRFEKIEARLHDLARRLSRIDFPFDVRLKHADFRSGRMSRFRRRFRNWFYTMESKEYFRTDLPEVESGELYRFIWFADQASHAFYDLGYNRKDLDDFIARQSSLVIR